MDLEEAIQELRESITSKKEWISILEEDMVHHGDLLAKATRNRSILEQSIKTLEDAIEILVRNNGGRSD